MYIRKYKPLFYIIFFLASFGLSPLLNAQTNIEVFGQNRVQTRKFDWKFFDTKHFRIYHYDAAGRQLARYVSEQVENDINIIEKKLNSDFPGHFNIIVYNSYDEYRQSNVGRKYDSQLENIPAGTVDIVGDKLVVYFTGVHTDLRRQTRLGMSRAVMERMLFGENFREMVKNAILMNLPAWTVNGFIAYLVDGWDTKSNTDWKNLMEANPKAGFYELAEKQPELAGKAFWKYIADKYGENETKNLLYTMQAKTSLTQGIKMTLGLKVKAAYDSAMNFYRNIYAADVQNQEIPDSNTALIDVPVPKGSNVIVRNIKVAPKGNDIAYVQWDNGEYKVYLQKTQEDKQRSVILDGGRRDYNELPDPDYPIMAWSNNGLKLAIIYKKGNNTRLRIYNSVKGKIENYRIPPNRFDRVLGISFAEDDTKMIFSAIKKSQTDLYEFTVKGSRMKNITNDAWDDVQPWYVSGGSRKGILFLSNRPKANLDVPIGVNELPNGPMNVFFYNTKTQRRELLQMSDVTTGRVTQPIQYGSDNYAYLYDVNGIQNKYVVLMGRDVNNMDSAYAMPVTNYAYNILNHQYNPSSNKIAEVVQIGSQYKVYTTDVKIPDVNTEVKQLQQTTLSASEKKKISRNAEPHDARLTESKKASKKRQQVVANEQILKSGNTFQSEFDEPVTDSSSVPSQDAVAGNETFEPEVNAEEPVQTLPEVTDVLGNEPNTSQNAIDSAYLKMKAQPYRTAFRLDNFSIKLDNTVLFNRYQSVKQTGGTYQNPPLGGLVTLSLEDVMENHRFTGGFKLPFDFSGTTYFIQYENFKRRVDWGLLYLRSTTFQNYLVTYIDTVSNFIIPNEQLGRISTNMLQASASYPLDRVRSIRMQMGLREDNLKFKSQDELSLAAEIEDPRQYWVSSRVEYVFDNSIKPAMNVYNGYRYKFFAEYLYRLNGTNGGFYNFGTDFRYYHKIYKNFIWANRIAAAHSGGNQKILYNMGGVDNWMFAKYSNYVPVRPTENYAFQALATNLRGYEQNSRNGNTYAVYNTELRLPILPTFMKRPIQSSFLRNLQAVAFVDAGSAWKGLAPNADALRNDRVLPDPSDPDPTYNVSLSITDQTGGLGLGYGAGLRTSILGYFLRADAGWNIEGRRTPILYFSIGTDF